MSTIFRTQDNSSQWYQESLFFRFRNLNDCPSIEWGRGIDLDNINGWVFNSLFWFQLIRLGTNFLIYNKIRAYTCIGFKYRMV
jgi:hypothetical protein